MLRLYLRLLIAAPILGTVLGMAQAPAVRAGGAGRSGILSSAPKSAPRERIAVTLPTGWTAALTVYGLATGPAAGTPRAAPGRLLIRNFALPWTGVSQGAPSIGGHLLVWAYDHLPSENLAVTDTSTGRTVPVVTSGTAVTPPFGPPSPAIDRHLVVWMDCRACSVRNLATGRTLRLTHDAGEHAWPAISGHTVVWQQVQNGRSRIAGVILP